MELVFLFALSVGGIFAFNMLARGIERSFVGAREKRTVAEIATASETRKPGEISLALGVCEFLRTACIAAATAFGLVLLYVGIVEIFIRGGMPMRWLYGPIAWAGAEHKSLDFLSTAWTVTAILLAILALALIAGRDRRRAVARRFEDAQKQGLDRLLAERKGGHWLDLPPTDTMNAIETEATKAVSRREEMLREAGRQGISAEVADKALQGQLDELRFQYAAQDVLRRLRLEWKRIVEGDPSPNDGPWLRVRDALVSRGLITTLNSGSKFMSLVTLTLLFASTVTLGTGQSQAVITRVEDLAVGKTWNAAQQALAKAANDTSESTPSENHVDTQIDKERAEEFLSRQLAANYESALTPDSAPDSRTERVKAEILAQDMDPHAAVATVARQVMDDDVAPANHGIMEKAAEKLRSYVASWHEPDTASNFRGVILDNVMATVLDTSKPTSFSGQVLKEFAGDVSPDAIRKGFRSFIIRNAANIASAKDDKAITAVLVSKPGPGELPPTQAAAIQSATVQATKRMPAIALTQRPAIADPEVIAVAQSAGDLNELRPDIFVKAQSIMNAVSDYGDVYALDGGTHSNEFETAKNVLHLPDPDPMVSMAVGHDFDATVAAPQTGGVVIGRAVPGGQKVEVRGMSWNDNGDTVTITLKGVDGQEKSIGPLDRDIVHQALAYAADGRVAAVTMMATPFDVERVAIHPALSGTALGCNVIESDTWIFASVEDTQAFTAAERLWYSTNDLYKVAWATRLLALISPDKRAAVDELTRERSLAETDAAVALMSATPFSPQVSHIAEETNYYDAELVKSSTVCASHASGNLATFENCMTTDAKTEVNELYAETKSKEATNRRLSAEPPEFGLRSGLTEAEFSVDADFNFLRLEDNTNPLWPFDVAIQAVAESAPAMLDQDQQKSYVERKAWSFEALQPLIQERLIDYFNHHPEDQRAFGRVRQFTIAQRLFRSALNGAMGENFPLEKLAALSAETAAFTVKVATPRWYRHDLRPSQSSMNFYLSALNQWSNDPEILTGADRAEVESCIQALEGQPGKCPDKARVEEAEACKGAGCANAGMLRFAAFVSKLRETEHTAKLDTDAVAWTSERLKSCSGQPRRTTTP